MTRARVRPAAACAATAPPARPAAALEPFDRILHRERLRVRAVTQVPVGLQIPENFAQQEASIHSQRHLPYCDPDVHNDEGMKGLVL